MSDPVIGQKRLAVVILASGTYPISIVFYQTPVEDVDEKMGERFCPFHPSRMSQSQRITPLGPKWEAGICQNSHCWKVKNDEPCHRYRARVEIDDIL